MKCNTFRDSILNKAVMISTLVKRRFKKEKASHILIKSSLIQSINPSCKCFYLCPNTGNPCQKMANNNNLTKTLNNLTICCKNLKFQKLWSIKFLIKRKFNVLNLMSLRIKASKDRNLSFMSKKKLPTWHLYKSNN